jgi:two-component system, cell cycle response regulator DivK
MRGPTWSFHRERLIEMMGGRIWAESEGLDKGSVFGFYLPIKRERLLSAKILIIEDNEQNMYLLTFLLSRYGYEVVQAYDGQKGIELAERENPDLILLDIQLPQMDGYAVARQIKAIQVLAGIPIVAVTSYAMVGDREKTIAAGCSGYIEKPINPDIFMEQIKEFLPGMAQGRGKDPRTDV